MSITLTTPYTNTMIPTLVGITVVDMDHTVSLTTLVGATTVTPTEATTDTHHTTTTFNTLYKSNTTSWLSPKPTAPFQPHPTGDDSFWNGNVPGTGMNTAGFVAVMIVLGVAVVAGGIWGGSHLWRWRNRVTSLPPTAKIHD